MAPIAPIDSPRHSVGFDACKVLEPKRKTLQSLEAERIMTVFQDAVKRMEVTMALPYVLESLPRFSVILGQELVTHMENHLRLQNVFNEVADELDKLSEQDKEFEFRMRRRSEEFQSSDSNKASFNECSGIKIVFPEDQQRKDFLIHQAAMLSQGIKNSLREMLRYFKKNPKSIEVILGAKLVRNKDHVLLIETLMSLDSIMKDRLLTSPFEQEGKKAYLADVIKRENKTNATREKLELKYSAAVTAKETEIARRDAMIIQLQNEMRLIEKINTEQQRRTMSEAFKQASLDSKASKAKVAKFYEDMFGCRKKIQEDRKDHRESETHLRKRTYKMATEVYNWVQKYDADLDTRQDEYDLYTRMYEAEKAELNKLQSRFEVLEKKYNAIMEERRMQEEAKAKQLEILRKQNEAAASIQAVWRGYQFRKLMRKQAKKTGKKGKGGK